MSQDSPHKYESEVLFQFQRLLTSALMKLSAKFLFKRH